MMLDQRMRYIKEKVLAPVATQVGSYVSPLQLTVLGGFVGLAAAASAMQGWYAIGLGLWWLNRVLDGLDGTVARLFDKQSDFGGYLDILVDHVIYAILPISLTLSVNNPVVYVAMLLMLATFYVNSASWMVLSSILEKRRLGVETSGEMTTISMPSGLIEGTETIIFYSLFFLLPKWIDVLFVIMGILVCVTILQRLIWAYQILGDAKE